MLDRKTGPTVQTAEISEALAAARMGASGFNV